MVSVLIPVYNAASWLEDCITSVLDQSFQNWECVLVDDGSTDHSREIIKKFTDPRIVLLSRPHQGIVSVLEYGLSHCRYPFIARMDADDRMPPDRLKLQLEYLQAHPETGLVSGRVELFSELPDARGYALYVDWINRQNSYADILLRRFVESPFAHPSVMFRAELRKLYGGYREGDFPEDYALWLHWLEAGVKMEKLPDTVLYWRDHGNRLSRTHSQYSPDAFRALKAEYLARHIKSMSPSRQIWVWGRGKMARRFIRFLEAHGIHIAGIVEVDPAKTGGNIIHYKTLGKPSGRFLLSLVSNQGAGAEVSRYLNESGWTEGVDYILAG